MDATTKAAVLRDMTRRMGAGGADITTDEWLDFVEAQNDGYRTGPEIGQKIPDFTLTDQHGQNRSLEELMGPKGLLLVFSRSADW
jgi:cytochrome oxidase Cu insertion factor (SCO1/SenC/PrrC family)